MLFSTLLLLLVVSASAAPQLHNAPKVVNNDATYAYAASIWDPTSLETMKCLKSSGYQAVFIRAYSNGAFDGSCVASVRNAYNAGLSTEVYMNPEPNSNLEGSQQLDIMMGGLRDNGIVVRTVWIMVTNINYKQPTWGTDKVQNTAFITSILTRARQLGLAVGIYTNANEWAQITNNWTGAGSDVLLWYWNTRGNGASNESQPNFDDYVAFGGFKTVVVKLFAMGETVCQLTVHRDVYSVGVSMKKSESFVAPDGKIVVGGIGL